MNDNHHSLVNQPFSARAVTHGEEALLALVLYSRGWEVLIWRISEKCKEDAMEYTPVIVIQGEAIWMQNLTYPSKVVIEIIIWI